LPPRNGIFRFIFLDKGEKDVFDLCKSKVCSNRDRTLWRHHLRKKFKRNLYSVPTIVSGPRYQHREPSFFIFKNCQHKMLTSVQSKGYKGNKGLPFPFTFFMPNCGAHSIQKSEAWYAWLVDALLFTGLVEALV